MRILRSSLTLCLLFSAAPVFAQPETPQPGGAPPAPPAQPAPPAAPAEPAPPAAAEPKPAEPAPKPNQPAPPVVQMNDTTGAAEPAAEVAQPQATTPAPEPGVAPTGGAPTTRGGPAAADSDEWKFEFHGYLRAPFRLGIGRRDGTLAAGQERTTLHAPVIPDDQYLSWQHTMHNQKDWAELFFSYGNSWAKGTVALQGFNFTDAAWTDSEAQFGIAQGWVTLTPELPYENVRLEWKVGSFWNRYGMAGRYDAGEYDTFLFGRTHAAGETVRVEIDVNDFTLGVEHGIGGKRPDPSEFNRAKFTLLHHAHADVTWAKTLEFGVHYLHSWAQEEDRIFAAQPAEFRGLPDGSMGVYGAEARLDANMFGYLYLGFSHIAAEDALTVAPAIEVLHAFGGGQFSLGVTDNYLDSPACVTTDTCSGGNGGVNTLLAQYEFSFANLLQNLEDPGSRFWGEGQDVNLTLYGMHNWISSDDPEQDGVKRLKYGADLVFNALPWLGVAARYDRVQPNSKIANQSFAVLSPRLIFRSKWVTHEEIQLQYSRYIYNQRECEAPATPADDPTYQPGEEFCVQAPNAPSLPDSFGSSALNGDRGAPTGRPDVNVFKIQASMWW